MPESFGARLRQRREQRQVALTTIAEQTKIKISLLEELERDDVSHWPSGIFRRAFIRAYAHAIGLEPAPVVREFLEIHPDPLEEVATFPAGTAIVPGATGAGESAGPQTRLRYLVGSAIGSLSRLRTGPVQRREPAMESPAPVFDAPVSEAPVIAIEPDAPVTASAPPDPPVIAPATPEPDLLASAHLCTELGCVDANSDTAPLLEEAARLLDAVGLVVWAWDTQAAELRPAMAHGYSDKVLAQLPKVKRDADNATAEAFRSTRTCVVRGGGSANGALAVPLMTPLGCVGVLAVELPAGSEQREWARALVTIFGAQLARIVCAARPAEATDRRLA